LGSQTDDARYVQELENHLARLLGHNETGSTADTTSNASDSQDTPLATDAPGNRYLGASCGLVFIESALKLASAQGILAPVAEIEEPSHDPELLSFIHLPNSTAESTGHALPDREGMEHVFAVFAKTHWHYSILTASDFQYHLGRYYDSEIDRPEDSVLVMHIIFAIVASFMAQNQGDSAAYSVVNMHYEKAIDVLPAQLRRKDLASLQMTLLFLLFSVANPQKPFVWHLLSHAVRIAVSFELHLEQPQKHIDQPSTAENDLRRRLFWSLYSMDRAVSNTFGRPTMLQDQYITASFPDRRPTAISLWNQYPEMSQSAITTHCFEIRRLQSEAADTLYQGIRDMPSGFIPDLRHRINLWFSQTPEVASPQMRRWFCHAYYNLQIFIHRPSPLNPDLSHDDYDHLFSSSRQVLQIYEEMHSSNCIESTWMAFHWLFSASVSHLFCLWTAPNLRNSVDWNDVVHDVQSASIIIAAMAERWRPARKMLNIYKGLSQGTLRRYANCTSSESSWNQLPDARGSQALSFPDINMVSSEMTDYWLGSNQDTAAEQDFSFY
jgi:hypothetical protein